MGENSFLRLLDTHSISPAVALDEGIALIEVADTVEGAPARIHVGDSVTELLKEGLYAFDANNKTLRVYGGEASTVVAGSTTRAKEGLTLDLQKTAPVTKFDTKARDALFKWSADRSFALFLTPAAFMTQWEATVRVSHYKHKQFGDRVDPRPPRRRPLPRF
jgi:hypothetical protein